MELSATRADAAAADMPVLRACRVSRNFGPVRALVDIDFDVAPGEVHALLGENGAGKSTLVKVLSGALAPSSGRVEFEGRPVAFGDPSDAIDAGVVVVHQDYNLFDERSVADNVVAIRQTPRRGPLLSRRRAVERTKKILTSLGVTIDPGAPVGELGAGERKMVEIARALADESKVVILDEPTASLDPAETEVLLLLVERLRDQGQGVVLVTHRLDEVRRLADRATVLRDGRRVGTLVGPEITKDRMVALMLGRAPEPPPSVATVRRDAPALAVSGLALVPGRQPFSLAVYGGEILGITGLTGSGAVDTLRCLAGLGGRKVVATVAGRRVRLHSPAAAVAAGIGYIPEDRKGAGLVLPQSVASNIVLADVGSVVRRGWLRSGRCRSFAERYRSTLDIRCADVTQPVEELSGGNQQKVLIARWIHAGVSVLLVEEPTHGVDVGARVAIHRQLIDLAAAGGAVVMVSSEPEELLAVCHRIAVFFDRELVATVDGATSSVGQLTALQTGATRSAPGSPAGGPAASDASARSGLPREERRA
jgi:ribose transport system ATP-binding protein